MNARPFMPVAIIATLLLVGCAGTPAKTVAQGEQYQCVQRATSSSRVRVVVSCTTAQERVAMFEAGQKFIRYQIDAPSGLINLAFESVAAAQPVYPAAPN